MDLLGELANNTRKRLRGTAAWASPTSQLLFGVGPLVARHRVLGLPPGVTVKLSILFSTPIGCFPALQCRSTVRFPAYRPTRVVPYLNDVFVHMDGTCLPLQDMRNAVADGTTVVMPLHAIVFWIKLKWKDALGFVCV